MPTILRRSGPDVYRNGKATTPRAMIHFCEDCGFEGAPFLVRRGGRLLSYCGWRDGDPVCIGKAKSEAA